jgi:hypothetical protein
VSTNFTILAFKFGAKGFEPMMPVPKTGAFPLGYAPTKAFIF